MKMTKEERIIRLIRKEEIDYLPSQIVFSDRSRDEEISESLGLNSKEYLDDYLENHLYLTMTLHDKPIFFRNDVIEMNRLQKLGFCTADWKNKVIYDSWGMGIKVGADGFFPCFHPLQGKATKEIAQNMPPDFNREILFYDIKKAIKKYEAPDFNKNENFTDMEKDLKEKSGKFMVWPSGHFGIYERAYGLMGWEEFMTSLVLKPTLIEELLDKITDFKVNVAKKIINFGFKMGHHGDDLGTQKNTFFSKKLFRKFLLPRLKRIFDVYKNANLPVMLHSCGNITEFIPDLIDIGLDILEPVQPCMDLKYLKNEFGRYITFFGGIDTQKLLPFASADEVKNKASRTIRILGKGGGLIISTAQEIMDDVPVANIKALVEAIVSARKIAL